MMFEETLATVQVIKNTKPLILNLTNLVTMEWVANGLLSLGASPIMTNSIQEIEDLVCLSSAVVLNIGTLNDEFLTLSKSLCEITKNLQKPLIFDPVGAGASALRTKACLNLLEQFQFTVIRGNASEIISLAGQTSNTKGVDSAQISENAIEAGLFLSAKYKATIAISGATDIIITAPHVEKIKRGHPIMTAVTGTGCLLTAVVAAFNAVTENKHQATHSALLFYSIAGEVAAKQSQGPGSFQINFLDALSQLPNKSNYE